MSILIRTLQFGLGRRLPVILQAEAAECGMACLAMILGYYGHLVDLGTLRRRQLISLKGSTMRDLIVLAGSVGLATRALRLEIQDFPRLRKPCVLHWGLNHFVVLDSVGKKSITIHDPARGRRTVSLDEVSREFTGVALEAAPSASFIKKDERNSLRLRHLFGNMSGFGASLVQIFLLSLGIELATLLMPIGSQIIIDEVIISADRDLLLIVALGLGLLLLVNLALAIARTWAIMLTGTTINFQWSTSLFDHLARLPLDYFEKRHVGDIISRFGSLATIQKALTTDLVQAVLDGVMSIGMLVMLFVYGGWLGLVAVGTSALDALVRTLAYQPYKDATEETIVNEARMQSHFIETVRGIASVKLLGLHDSRRAVWLNHLVDTLNARLRLQRLDLVFTRANETLFGLDRVLLLILGARMVMNSTMTLGMLVAFLAYRDQFAARVGSLVTSGFQLRMLNVQTARLADIVRTEPEADAGGPQAPMSHRGEKVSRLHVEGLSLRYSDNEPWIFRNVSLHFPEGQCIAITGPSGCGKTTLLKIVMGLMMPTEGAIFIDGVDIRTVGMASYRSRIAGVLQNDGLFAGTIGENICGFDANPDPGWMEECAARAAIFDDIQRMPMAFETLVGDMGSALSGGQMQRIVLARALYRRPEILLLDEATSHLDEANEAIIADALRELRMTRIIVAHRPATIAHADIVLPFFEIASASRATQQSGLQLA
ncbi:MAG: ABC transporter [Methylocystaceae bacterium]|nr:MAG: ABC transporter [Methylocystaceae bacterium]